jgi:Glyoxalase-like domain
VAHYSRVLKIVIDVPAGEHDRELAFWSAATGSALDGFDRHPEYHGGELPGSEFWLLVQRLEDAGPGRVHLDIHTDNLDAEVARLELLGAERVQQVHGWWVLRDPAGLLFCVLPSQPGSLDDSNAQRWD